MAWSYSPSVSLKLATGRNQSFRDQVCPLIFPDLNLIPRSTILKPLGQLLAKILLIEIGIPRSSGVPAVDEQHLLERDPSGGAVHVKMVAAAGQAALGFVRRHVLEGRRPSAAPFAVDFEHGIRGQRPRWPRR